MICKEKYGWNANVDRIIKYLAERGVEPNIIAKAEFDCLPNITGRSLINHVTTIDIEDRMFYKNVKPEIRKLILQALRTYKYCPTIEEYNVISFLFGIYEGVVYQDPYDGRCRDKVILSGNDRQLVCEFIGKYINASKFNNVLDISCYHENISILCPESDKEICDYFMESDGENGFTRPDEELFIDNDKAINLFLRSFKKQLTNEYRRYQCNFDKKYYDGRFIREISQTAYRMKGSCICSDDELFLYVIRKNFTNIKWLPGSIGQLSETEMKQKTKALSNHDIILNFVLPDTAYHYIPLQCPSDDSVGITFKYASRLLSEQGTYITLLHASNLIDKTYIKRIYDLYKMFPAAILCINERDSIYLVLWKKGKGSTYMSKQCLRTIHKFPNSYEKILDDIVYSKCKYEHAKKLKLEDVFPIEVLKLISVYESFEKDLYFNEDKFRNIVSSIGFVTDVTNDRALFIPVTEELYSEFGILNKDDYANSFLNYYYDYANDWAHDYFCIYNYKLNQEDAQIPFHNLFLNEQFIREDNVRINKSIIQINFNEKVDVQFMKYYFRSDAGKKFIELVRSKDSRLFLEADNLKLSSIYLPSLHNQKEIVRLYLGFLNVENTCRQNREELFFKKLDVDKLGLFVAESNSELDQRNSGLAKWCETLPFPLASILNRVLLSNDSKIKVEYLLDFFEKWTQFHAVLVLSMFFKDINFNKLTDQDEKKLKAYLEQNDLQSVRFDKPDWGCWIFILKSGKNLEQNCSISRFLHDMSDKRFRDILNSAREIRNFFAHGAPISDEELLAKYNKLFELLENMRGCILNDYIKFRLLYRNNEGERNSDNGFSYKALSAMGSSPLLFTIEKHGHYLPLVDSLWFESVDGMKTLKLMPFIQIRSFLGIQDNHFMQTYYYSNAEMCIKSKIAQIKKIQLSCYHTTHNSSLYFRKFNEDNEYVLSSEADNYGVKIDASATKLAKILDVLTEIVNSFKSKEN